MFFKSDIFENVLILNLFQVLLNQISLNIRFWPIVFMILATVLFKLVVIQKVYNTFVNKFPFYLDQTFVVQDSEDNAAQDGWLTEMDFAQEVFILSPGFAFSCVGWMGEFY